MSDKMKAVRLHAFGGPEMLVYEDAPRPGVKPGEVLVRAQAAGLNPPDWYLRMAIAHCRQNGDPTRPSH